ncbi:sulfate transporter [Trifolium medium]|uniref:Sulfate transporter n=1 Tax=Trifolium medium TaxID=97028 RepID=A0A392P2K1_9FABA|nr:sulfate transporter [Trifolium medium]
MARLPSKDRNEVLKVLKKKVRRRRGGNRMNRSCAVSHQASSEESKSSASVNNDWKHWVVMQGNEQVAVDDIWGLGKAITVKFNGDNMNMFNVLSRAGKGKQVASSQLQGGRGRIRGARFRLSFSEWGRGVCVMKIIS